MDTESEGCFSMGMNGGDAMVSLFHVRTLRNLFKLNTGLNNCAESINVIDF